LVNDRVDVALALRLAGVHLGQRSLTPPVARELLGPDALIGRSVHDLEEAGDPENRDADYLVAGSVFPTSSHPGKPGGGADMLRRLGAETTLPILAIGGITASRVQEVMVPGVFGVAVLSGVWMSEDPGEAVTVYLKELEAAVGQNAEGIRTR
jgi:thiamine-phosphate diphosphorylase